MSDISHTRRENLRRIVKERGTGKVAADLGYNSANFLSQMTGPKPSRDITEKTARKFEKLLDLQPGALDVPVAGLNQSPVTAPAAANVDPSVVADVIRMVGTILAEENVSVGPSKMADVIALAYMDMAEHAGKPRAEHIRNVVRLLK